MKVRAFYPTTVTLDDPDTGELITVKVRVKRFTVDESSRFNRDYYRSANPPSDALIARRPDGEEQDKNEKKEFLISDDVVRQRRLAEMTSTERAAFFAADAEEKAFTVQFILDTITNYVTVETGQISEDVEKVVDGQPVTVPVDVRTGADLVRIYGGRNDVLMQFIRVVQLENAYSAPLKKMLRSRSDSGTSSGESLKAADGPTPAPTAPAAASVASAETEGADGPATSPSGSAASI